MSGNKTLDGLWSALWEDLRHNATGRPSGLLIISGHREGIETEAAVGLSTLRTALWQCGVESGMDTDGDAGPGAMIAGMGDAGFAAAMVEQVRQLRLAYDECLAEPESADPITRAKAAADATPAPSWTAGPDGVREPLDWHGEGTR